MRATTILAALLIMGCNEMAGVSGEGAQPCSASEPCQDGLVCVDELCVKSPTVDEPDPEVEREADDLGKLGVERDMLESKVQTASEELAEAVEEWEDATGGEQKRAALQKKTRAAARHKSATEALSRFAKKTSR